MAIGKGQSYDFGVKKVVADNPKSDFNMSNINTFTCDIGQIIPFYTLHTLPGDRINDLKITSLIRIVNPPKKPLMSTMKAEFSFFYAKYSDLMKKWETLMSKGHSRTAAYTVPKLKITQEAITANMFEPGSLSDHLGVPTIKNINNKEGFKFTALKHFMYFKTWKTFYVDINTEYIKNAKMYPDDVADCRLEPDTEVDLAESTTWGIKLGELKYANYDKDYFTAASPFPHGIPTESPTLEAQLNTNITEDIQLAALENISVPMHITGHSAFIVGRANTEVKKQLDIQKGEYITGFGEQIITNGGTNVIEENSKIGIKAEDMQERLKEGLKTSISIWELRELNAINQELEILGRTNGTYKEFIEGFYGFTPNNEDYLPVRIASTYQPIMITQVLNTTSTPDGAPLGEIGGQGISSGSDDMGAFNIPDYGIIMGLMHIKPDTYYHDKISREDSALIQEEFYLPVRNQIEWAPIINEELYYNEDNPTKNKELFAWKEIYTEKKMKENEVHGLLKDVTKLSYSPWLLKRTFTETPMFNPEFQTLGNNNVSKEWQTNDIDPAFIVQIKTECYMTRPIPYKNQAPGLFGKKL